jgi:hypothetical protein
MRRTGYSDRLQITPRPGELFAIPLDEAWYCESCRVILNDSTCFCCASAEHTNRLAPWLDREHEPIRIPPTGVFLTVIPASKKRPERVDCAPAPALPRAS